MKLQIFFLSAPFSNTLLCTVFRKYVIYVSEIIRGYLTKFELNVRTMIYGYNRSSFRLHVWRNNELHVQGHRVTGTQVEGYWCSGIGLLLEGQGSWRRDICLLIGHRIIGRGTRLIA